MAADNGFRHYVDILCNEAFPALGRFPQTGESMKASLEAAGFVDIHVAEYKCPIGPWPLDRRLKKIGAMTLMTMETGLEAYAMAALTRVLGMNKAEAEKVCADAWKAAKNKNTHMYVMQ